MRAAVPAAPPLHLALSRGDVRVLVKPTPGAEISVVAETELVPLNSKPALGRKALRLAFSGAAGTVKLTELAVRYMPKTEVQR